MHWMVQDRKGRPVYLTQERWNHITARHPELDSHLTDVLDTVRLGRRRQGKRDPNTYTYRRACPRLPVPYNLIVVAVVFRWQESPDSETVPNNFVVSAWGKCVPSME